MINKKSPFLAYRYLVTPISEQTSIFQQLNKSKEELISDIISYLATNTKTEWLKGNKRFLFYGFQKKSNIFIIKFAKETTEKLFIEGDEDIEIQGIKEAKFVYLIIDTEHQIVLLERNVTVFQQIQTSVNILSDFFRSQMREFDYVVNIYPLVSGKKFWSYVNSAEQIFELSLEMNAPNLFFFGHQDTRDVLKLIKETTNNEVLDISFKNKEGKLKVLKEFLGDYIDYVIEVGGKYLLKFSLNGVRETKTSETDTVKTYIERKKTEKYSDDELENIAEKLKLINNIESRDDVENEE